MGVKSIMEPGPFHISCDGLAADSFLGQVVEADHLLSGLSLELYHRADFGPDRTYDITGTTHDDQPIVGFVKIAVSDAPPLS